MRTTITTSCMAACLLTVPALLAPAFAETLPRDTCAKWETTQPERLIEACSEAIAIDAKAAWAYLNRGIAYAAIGKSDEELADYSKAIEIDPWLVNAWQNRGVARFDRGEFADAAGDFARAVAINTDPYAMLLLYLARTRSGASGTAELEANVAKLSVAANWPYAAIQLFLGRRTIPAVRSAAVTKEHRCEAQFYIGEWLLTVDKKAEALRPLRLAATLCSKGTVELNSTVAELKRLGADTTPLRPAPVRASAPAARPANAAAPAANPAGGNTPPRRRPPAARTAAPAAPPR